MTATMYAALADLRADPALKLAAGETADDTLLTGLLVSVSRLIDRTTGRIFEADADTTRYFDARRDVDWSASNRNYGVFGYGGFAVTLNLDDDLAQITSITNGDGVTLQTSDYVTEPRNVLTPDNGNYTPIWAIRLKWSSGKFWTFTTDFENAIAIVGRWAYSVTPPEAIRRATIIGAAALYKQSLSGDSDRPIVTGGGTIIEPSRMPATFWHLVNAFVRKT